MIESIILILVGLLLFKLAGGLGIIFAFGLKVLGAAIIIGAIMELVGVL